MGSKNNPHNRGKKQIKTYKGEEVVPAMLIRNASKESNDGEGSGGGRIIIAQYSKSRKMVKDANGLSIQWDSI